MALTNKGSKWEWEHSWFCIVFSVLFPFTFIAYFMMNARVPKSQYLIKGFISLFFIVIILPAIGLVHILVIAIPLLQIVLSVICAFVDRPSYLKELADQTNKSYMESRMKTEAQSSKESGFEGEEAVASSAADKIKTDIPEMTRNDFDTETMININSADESAFAAVPLLNVIDVKKIIQFREANGSFESKDQFFECFNAKPHVISKLEPQIILGYDEPAPSLPGNPKPRRFDL